MPYVIAHRGASIEAPENTIASIKRALALKSHYVEIDVRLSKEGVPILLHDDSAARMLGISCAPFVHDLSLSEIQAIDVGRLFNPAFIGETIPTLAEVLRLEWKKTGLMLEIKECPQNPQVIVEAIFRVLIETPNLPPSLIIGSFSPSIIQEVQRHQHRLPSLQVIGIVEESEMLDSFLKQDLHHLALWHPLITNELIHSLHSKQFDVWAFTIDSPDIAKSLVSLGITGIISNDPQTILKGY